MNYLLNEYKRKFKVMKTKYYDLKRIIVIMIYLLLIEEVEKSTLLEILEKALLK